MPSFPTMAEWHEKAFAKKLLEMTFRRYLKMFTAFVQANANAGNATNQRMRFVVVILKYLMVNQCFKKKFTIIRLTIRWSKSSTLRVAPTDRMNVWRIFVTPVIVGIVPLIKMNEKTISQNVCNSCHANEIGILSIDSFKFHVFLETVKRCTRLK